MFIENILQMVTYEKNITIALKYEVIYSLSIVNLHLTLSHSKSEGNGHAKVDGEYLRNYEIYGIDYYCYLI